MCEQIFILFLILSSMWFWQKSAAVAVVEAISDEVVDICFFFSPFFLSLFDSIFDSVGFVVVFIISFSK